MSLTTPPVEALESSHSYGNTEGDSTTMRICCDCIYYKPIDNDHGRCIWPATTARPFWTENFHIVSDGEGTDCAVFVTNPELERASGCGLQASGSIPKDIDDFPGPEDFGLSNSGGGEHG